MSQSLASSGALGGIDDPEGADAASHGAAAAKAAAETGELDVAAILAQGQERELINGTPKETTTTSTQNDKEEDPTSTTVILRGAQVPVGPIRFRWAEPLLDPAVLNMVSSLTEPLTEERVSEPLPIEGITPISKPKRHWSTDPRFDVLGAQAWEPSLENGQVDWTDAPSLADTLLLAAEHVGEPDTERRPQLIDTLIFSGATQATRGLSTLLLRSIRSKILGDDEPPPEVQSKNKAKPRRAARPVAQSLIQEEPNPLQPHTVRAAKFPEYFFVYKDHPEQVDFLGACVYGKVCFPPLLLLACGIL